MRIRRPTMSELAFGALLLAGIIVLAIDWQRVLAILAIGCALALLLSAIISLPVFVISLCVEWSVEKAARRTRQAACVCVGIVAELLGHAV